MQFAGGKSNVPYRRYRTWVRIGGRAMLVPTSRIVMRRRSRDEGRFGIEKASAFSIPNEYRVCRLKV
ncbi:MAG: hypothetical protein IKS21_03180 [Oscillospiraceae bacterium]|nr:hypothetical protein [Oscillospiraceae bacterium]